MKVELTAGVTIFLLHIVGVHVYFGFVKKERKSVKKSWTTAKQKFITSLTALEKKNKISNRGKKNQQIFEQKKNYH